MLVAVRNVAPVWSAVTDRTTSPESSSTYQQCDPPVSAVPLVAKVMLFTVMFWCRPMPITYKVPLTIAAEPPPISDRGNVSAVAPDGARYSDRFVFARSVRTSAMLLWSVICPVSPAPCVSDGMTQPIMRAPPCG